MVDAIISEDSDCLPYGCKEVLYKLDHHGNCEKISIEDAFKPIANDIDLPSNYLDLSEFDHSMFVTMCVAAGCDYLPSAKGLGIKKSYKFVKQYR